METFAPPFRLRAPFPRRLFHVLHTCISREEFREGAFGAVVLYSSPLRFSVVGRKLLKNQVTRADRCALVFRENVLEEFFLSTYASRTVVSETTLGIVPRERKLEEFPFLCIVFEDVWCLLLRCRRHCGPATWVLEEFVARRRHLHETTVVAAPRRQNKKLLKRFLRGTSATVVSPQQRSCASVIATKLRWHLRGVRQNLRSFSVCRRGAGGTVVPRH